MDGLGGNEQLQDPKLLRPADITDHSRTGQRCPEDGKIVKKKKKEKKVIEKKTESSADNCPHAILVTNDTEAGDASRGKTKVLAPGANDPQGNTRQPESPYWWAGEWGEKVESRATLWGRSRLMSQ